MPVEAPVIRALGLDMTGLEGCNQDLCRWSGFSSSHVPCEISHAFRNMPMNRIFAFVAATLIAVPGAAFAAQGKAGLWSVTTTLQSASFQVSPAFSATMLHTGLNLPTNGQPLVTQMCMT